MFNITSHHRMQIKTIQRPSDPRVAATEKTTNASQGAEKREFLHTADESAICLVTMIISKNKK